MKFSIRLLIAVTMLAALAIYASMTRKDVALLERSLNFQQYTQNKLETEAARGRQWARLAKSVLESEKHGADGEPTPADRYRLAKERFERLEVVEVDK